MIYRYSRGGYKRCKQQNYIVNLNKWYIENEQKMTLSAINVNMANNILVDKHTIRTFLE